MHNKRIKTLYITII